MTDQALQNCPGCGGEHVPFSVGLHGQSVDDEGRPICWGCYVESGRSQLDPDHAERSAFADRIRREGLPPPGELLGEPQARELGRYAGEIECGGLDFCFEPTCQARPRWKHRHPDAEASVSFALHTFQFDSVDSARAFWQEYWIERLGECDD